MKKLIYILAFIFILQTVNSATVQGNVYDISLDLVKNSIVEINTIPNQKLVARDGSYIFSSVPKGSYEITAYTSDNLKTTENITIEQDGTYTIDLFLIPELKEGDKKSNLIYYLFSIIILIIIVILIIKFRKKKPKKSNDIDEDLQKVLEIIKKDGNRTTQKHIKEVTGLSEAKVSLMITDLESKNIVKRIKKGRSNIIILEANK